MMSTLQEPRDKPTDLVEDYSMHIYSPEFSSHGEIPEKYTFMGENINPPIVIENVPSWAKSLILILEDMDARSSFINWIVYNINPEVKIIESDTAPGIVGYNSVCTKDYYGPTPLQGCHDYRFTLYAIDEKFSLDRKISPQELHNIVDMFMHEKAELIGKITCPEIRAIE